MIKYQSSGSKIFKRLAYMIKHIINLNYDRHISLLTTTNLLNTFSYTFIILPHLLDVVYAASTITICGYFKPKKDPPRICWCVNLQDTFLYFNFFTNHP